MKRHDMEIWLNRLRDPNSKQAVGAPVFGRYNNNFLLLDGSFYQTVGNEPMCCLVHGQHAIEGHSEFGRMSNNNYWAWAERNNLPIAKLSEMNDYEGKSLTEIADWIEKNVPVED